MAGDGTDLADVRLDLLSIQARALAAVREYGQYLRDAEHAGLPEVAYFVRQLLEEDSARAAHSRALLRRLGASTQTRPAPQPAGRGSH
jgi:hypothetical protein